MSGSTGEESQLRQTCTGVSPRDEFSRAFRRSPHDSGTTSYVLLLTAFNLFAHQPIHAQFPVCFFCFQPPVHATTRSPSPIYNAEISSSSIGALIAVARTTLALFRRILVTLSALSLSSSAILEVRVVNSCLSLI